MTEEKKHILCASRSFLRFDMTACSEAKGMVAAAVAAGVWTMLSDQILDVVAIILYMQHTIHLINLINLYISKAAQTSETENVWRI